MGCRWKTCIHGRNIWGQPVGDMCTMHSAYTLHTPLPLKGDKLGSGNPASNLPFQTAGNVYQKNVNVLSSHEFIGWNIWESYKNLQDCTYYMY